MSQKTPLYGRYLLKGDVLTNRQAKRTLDQFFQTSSGLIISKEHAGICEGCGREKYKVKTDRYFGQEFCVECIEKWKQGGR